MRVFKILGTIWRATRSNKMIYSEDRDRFSETLSNLNIQQPKNGFAKNLNEATSIANEIGYPVFS